MEPRRIKNLSARWVTLRRDGLRRLHPKEPRLSWVQERRQTVNRRHRQLHQTRTGRSHQKGPVLSQLSFGRLRRRWAKIVLARLPRITRLIKKGSPRLRRVLDQQRHGHPWNHSTFLSKRKNMTEEEGINVIERCLNSMKERFIMSQTSFTIKIIRKDGIKIYRAPEVPKGGAWFVGLKVYSFSFHSFGLDIISFIRRIHKMLCFLVLSSKSINITRKRRWIEFKLNWIKGIRLRPRLRRSLSC